MATEIETSARRETHTTGPPSRGTARLLWQVPISCTFAAISFVALSATLYLQPLSYTPEQQTESRPSDLIEAEVSNALETVSLLQRDLETLQRKLKNSEGDDFRLQWAEAEFQRNLQRRAEKYNGMIDMEHAASYSNATLREDFYTTTYPCALEGRFGNWGEGGKWICLSHRHSAKKPLVLSVGSNGDESFEADVFRRLGAFSHTLDFTLQPPVRQRMQSYSFLRFWDKGLIGTSEMNSSTGSFDATNTSATMLTVQQVLHLLNTSYIDIAKIDCEGCEFSVVEDLSRMYTKDKIPFGQIQVEVHYLTQVPMHMKLLLQLEGLGYRLFHAEMNSYYVQGFELAFIHESLVRP